jgi:hypothetical protein
MCGLVGVASTTPKADLAWLRVARDTLIHRGPDDAGAWWSEEKILLKRLPGRVLPPEFDPQRKQGFSIRRPLRRCCRWSREEI